MNDKDLAGLACPPPPTLKNRPGFPSGQDKEVGARAQWAGCRALEPGGPEESESLCLSEGPEVRAGLEQTRADSPRLITTAHDARRTPQQRCRVQSERNDRGQRPLRQTATAQRTPPAEAGGRGHTWQPLTAGHLGAPCGAGLALWLAAPETGRKAGRSCSVAFYPVVSPRPQPRREGPIARSAPQPLTDWAQSGSQQELSHWQQLLLWCNYTLTPLENSAGVLSSNGDGMRVLQLQPVQF